VITDADFRAARSLLKLAEKLHRSGKDVRPPLYLLKLLLEDIEHANRSIAGCAIHSTGAKEVQIGSVRTYWPKGDSGGREDSSP
jgi:hypothetical protein